MRIERLELRAFGPFTDEVLDLSAPPPALHLVHGRNEAGKSTTRRALEGLLYGIPERTPDAHLHAPAKLRVGAVLVAADGQRLHVVRRKGRKNTLLDVNDEPLDEGRLEALLRGVSRERFLATFALGHDTLRSGAADLERALGDVGESLFDAGLGGQGVHRVLASLREECDGLWAPRATTKPLAKALAEFKSTLSAQRKGMLSESALREQRRALRELREREQGLRSRRRALREEVGRLNRARDVLPLLAQRQALLAEREELGDPPRLADDAATRRVEAVDAREDARRRLARAEATCAKLREQLEALPVHEALLAVPESVLETIDERLGRHRSAVADRPKRDRDLRNADREVSEMLARLGRDLPPEEGGAVVADERLAARVHALSEERGPVRKDHEHAEARAAELRLVVADLEQRLAAPLDEDDGLPLDQASSAVRSLGDVVARRDDLTDAAARAEAAWRSAWAGLDPRPDETLLEHAERLPERERVAAFAEAREQQRTRAERLSERQADQRERLERAEVELEAERAAGELPEADALQAARERRDAHWRAVREGSDPSGPEGQGLERGLQETDALADRLRHEAARVERARRLEVELRAARKALTEGEQQLSELAEEQARHDDEWAALWTASELPPGEPRERLRWLDAWSELLARHGEHRAATEALASFQARVAETAAQVHAACAAHGPGDGSGEGPDERPDDAPGDAPARAPVDGLSPDADPSVETLLVLAERLEALRAARGERRREVDQARARLDQARLDLTVAEGESARLSEALGAWSEAWAAAMQALDLPGDARGSEALDVLARHRELATLLERRSGLVRRLAGMDRDAEAFETSVRELAERIGEPRPDVPVEEIAQDVVRRHRQARADARRRDELADDLSAAQEELRLAGLDGDEAASRLEQLLRAAGVEREEQLPEAEALSARARQLDERLQDLDGRIVDTSDGTHAEALQERYHDLSIDRARADIEDLESEQAGLDDELGAVREELGSLEKGLAEQQGDRAAELAQQAQGHLGRVRELARRWATRRLATVLLEREIERYREEHQGPVLSRASELFPRLTEGRYTGLRAEIDDGDSAVLRCVRADGERLDVTSLSDGTRDQLYLALRVASLERQARHDEPFPLVVDDVLVHFDDVRTRLALGVLGELAQTTQVLLFTHHERVVELAREAIPSERLVEHGLDSLARVESAAPTPREAGA